MIDIESHESHRETGRQNIKDGGSIDGRADNNGKKWSKPNSGRHNISQSGNEKQENLPKQGILTA